MKKYFIISNNILYLPWTSINLGSITFVLSDKSGNTVHGHKSGTLEKSDRKFVLEY